MLKPGVDFNEEIRVTEPFLPALDEFVPYLQRIWETKWLTNGGAMCAQLERALCAYLGVEHLGLLANGTLALMVALRALDVSGEVITTPYTFIATPHALRWAGVQPVFVDIDPRTLTLDPSRIEAAITPRTTAIMPVHCYGNRCDVEAIDAIAARHRLRVVYDAAHAFAVCDGAGSLMRHGDLSVLSFHATKIFSTIEGGAIICRDAAMLQRVKRLTNFGLADEETVTEVGINGKMNEVSAAFGLFQLGYVTEVLARLRGLYKSYRSALQDVEGIRCVELYGQEQANHGFFPVLVEPAYPLTRDVLYGALRDAGIHARRYFFPLVTTFPMYANHPSAARTNLPVAQAISEQVLCLPIFAAMTDNQQGQVVEVIRNAWRNGSRHS